MQKLISKIICFTHFFALLIKLNFSFTDDVCIILRVCILYFVKCFSFQFSFVFRISACIYPKWVLFTFSSSECNEREKEIAILCIYQKAFFVLSLHVMSHYFVIICNTISYICTRIYKTSFKSPLWKVLNRTILRSLHV